MLKEAIALWKKEKGRKGTTLYRRLLLFFVMITVSLVLTFALLLSLFGITGREAKATENHIDTELSIISDEINNDFGRISLGGVTVSENLSMLSDNFFEENGISASEMNKHPELIEPLLSEYMPQLVSTINTRICGGVFVLLDASVYENSENSKAGIFIKKTQPTATDDIGVQLHYLRGPASLARENNIMIMGQWLMEFDTVGEEFFADVMETARNNPELPLSRLYYWSERVTLKDNSEAGFLLCVPLRSDDGTVFGIFGIEVSDRLFKSLYEPEGGDFENIFTLMAMNSEDTIRSSLGLVAGNRFLSSTNWDYDLTEEDSHEGFHHYSGGNQTFGGKTASLKLYPGGSPFAEDEWSVSILMPKDILHAAVKGNNNVFIIVLLVLLVISLVASFLFSRQYLKPVTGAIDKIKNSEYSGEEELPYEIGDLFVFLSQKDREYDNAIHELREENQKAQTEISRLSYSRKTEIDPDNYKMFLENLHTLTDTERIVFGHYLEGKGAKEIMEIMNIKETTLKYHNRNIYDKLGVASRKELLRYAAIMNSEKTE